MRTCEKRAKGVILDSSKPFIPNLGCKRKIIIRSASVSLLEWDSRGHSGVIKCRKTDTRDMQCLQ